MKDENYHGDYAIEILLTNTAWSNKEYNKRIKQGELEKILKEAKGVKSYWKAACGGRYQNVPVLDSEENAFNLMKKLNKLPYIRKMTLLKDGLRGREGYISVEEKDI